MREITTTTWKTLYNKWLYFDSRSSSKVKHEKTKKKAKRYNTAVNARSWSCGKERDFL